jgi:hypothetical protein
VSKKARHCCGDDTASWQARKLSFSTSRMHQTMAKSSEQEVKNKTFRIKKRKNKKSSAFDQSS